MLLTFITQSQCALTEARKRLCSDFRKRSEKVVWFETVKYETSSSHEVFLSLTSRRAASHLFAFFLWDTNWPLTRSGGHYRENKSYYPDNDHRSVHYPLLIWCSQKPITPKVWVPKFFKSLFVTVHSSRNIVCRTDDEDVEQLIKHPLKFESSNQSVETDMAHAVLFFLFSMCRSSSILSTSLSS